MPARTTHRAVSMTVGAGRSTSRRARSSVRPARLLPAPQARPPRLAPRSAGLRPHAGSYAGEAKQVRDVLGEDAQMCERPRAHELLVHVGLPGQLLHVLVATDADEALAARVIRIPEALHDPQHHEDAPMRPHELATCVAERACV